MSRPEHLAPPEIYYDDKEASKYTNSSRYQKIQADMTLRCLELLALPEEEPAFLLDIGCGSGLSGEILEEEGHVWVGVDVAPSMLEVALDREVEGDLFLQDIGQGFGFRPGSFDGAVSVSVIQWLFNADQSSHSPPARLLRFFTTLHSALKRPSRAVLQFYPESDDQVHMALSMAMKAGFGGGLVVDFPNSKKAKKFYLCLMVGGGISEGSAASKKQELPKGLTGDEDGAMVKNEMRRTQKKQRGDRRKGVKESSKDWILRKKELYRTRGKEDVPTDSKFTGRKRKARF